MAISIPTYNQNSGTSGPDGQKTATNGMPGFGVAGPGNVEALEHPMRNETRMSLTSENNYGEGSDMFLSTPVAGTRSAFKSRSSFKKSASEMERWSASPSPSRMSGSTTNTSHRFAQPLVSEGEGSVFPTSLPLAKRRAFEVELIRKFDKLEINTNVGDFWFVIDAIWMNSWVDFVMGKTGPPGPISNYNLYTRAKKVSPARRECVSMLAPDTRQVSRGSFAGAATHVVGETRIRRSIPRWRLASRPDLKLKEGLSKVKDYRAVHSLVWYLFREIYATDDAPDLCRWKADLYSDEVTATRKLRVEQKSHPTAVYELRRFVAKIKQDLDREEDAAAMRTTP